MGTCPSCGNRKLGLRVRACDLCQRPICDHCGIPFASKTAAGTSPVPYGSELTWSLLGYHRAAMFQPPRSFSACSWACFDRWAIEMLDRGDIPSVRHNECTLAGLTLSPTAAERALRILSGRQTSADPPRA